MTKENLVEVARSFSYKLNAGNYESRDFFCSQKAEVTEDKAVEKSEELYEFCKNEVMKSVGRFLEEKNTKSVELGKAYMKKHKIPTSKERMDKANAMFEQSRGELQEQKDHEESQDWDAQTKEGRKFRKDLEKEEQEDSGWEHTKDSPEKQVPFK